MLLREIVCEAPGDWSVMVDGEFIGYARTEQQAHAKADAYAYTLLSRQPVFPEDEPIEDLFSAGQNAVTMTVPCPTCYGETHAVYTHVDDVRRAYRKCSTNAAHVRVRVL
jgi:ABC-type dipeptide/oligopeptide/nickel transport system ATPase component